MSEIKKQLRHYLKIQWKNLSIDYKYWRFLQNQIQFQVVHFFKQEILNSVKEGELNSKSKLQTWGAYMPLADGTEIDLGIFKYSEFSDLRWSLPRITNWQQSEMSFYKCDSSVFNLSAMKPWENKKKSYLGLEKNFLGIVEPDACAETVTAKELTGVIVPGLGFSTDGFRLGRGKGFYDKFLSTALIENPQLITVGICPKKCLIKSQKAANKHKSSEVELIKDELIDFKIAQDWDQPVNWIITEEGYFRTDK